MKKLIIPVLITLSIFTSCQKQEAKATSDFSHQTQQIFDSASQSVQIDEPVYIDFFDHESLICEYALNKASKDSIKLLEPYIKNGRFYFICSGLPLSDGNLKNGYEFSLSIRGDEKFWYNPSIKAVYNGSDNIRIIKKHGEGMYLIGYAERGSIVITNIFNDVYKLQEWAKAINWVKIL